MRLTFLFVLCFSAGAIYSFDPSYPAYDTFLKHYVCNTGVAYSKLVADTLLEKVSREFSSLSQTGFDSLKEADKIAYLVNLYNFYTIILIKNNYPIKSIRKINKPWDTPFVPLFGKKVALNYLEHEMLRKQFKEPRIHFALVCASVSCPTLSSEAFTGDKLDQQLTRGAKLFLKDALKNRVENNTLVISKIFEWYGDDFKNAGGGYIQFITSLLGLTGSYKVSFLPYNWDLNEVAVCDGK